MGLFDWRHEIGSGVKIEPALAKRFAMVGDVDHGCVDPVFVRGQHIDDLRQIAVGLDDRVVVGVGELLGGAVGQLGRPAIGHEPSC